MAHAPPPATQIAGQLSSAAKRARGNTVLKITVGHRPISVQKLGGAEIRDYGRPSCPSTKWPTTLSVNEGTKCERLHCLFLCSGSVEYR